MCDTSGIYKIENLVSGKIYVGQSRHIKSRFIQHKSELRNGSHYNKHLQYAWDKYGEVSFVFSIIEECPIELLNERELYWIDKLDTYNSGYNKTLGGDGVLGCNKGVPKSEEHKRKDSIAVKRWCAIHGGGKSTKIICLNTKEIFRDAVVAGSKFCVDPSSIRKCCKRRVHSAGELNGERLTWANYSDYICMSEDQVAQLIDDANSCRSRAYVSACRPVICLDTGDVFDSIKIAADHFGLFPSNVSTCCKGRLKGIHGLHFRYCKDLEVA